MARARIKSRRTPTGDRLTHVVAYGEVRKAMMMRLDTGAWPSGLDRISEAVRFDSFTAATESEARDIFAKGYDLGSSRTAIGDIYIRPRRRMRWGDDGDLDVGAALAGDDFPFTRWDMRPKKPGLAIVCEVAFNYLVPASVITDYGAWLVREIKQLETDGYDLAVTVAMPIGSLFIGTTNVTDVQVTLKRENEASDFRTWSPMFSPLGFRGLGFTAFFIVARTLGRTCSEGLGYASPGGEWDVLFNSDTRTMRVTVPGNAKDFDAVTMTNKLRAALPEAN